MNYFVLNKDIHGQVVSLTFPRRDYKCNSVFSEGFFQTSLKFRSLQTSHYTSFSRKLHQSHFEQIMETWKKRKNWGKDLPFTFTHHGDPDSENSQGRWKQMGIFTFRKGENWAYPCRLQKSKQELPGFLVPSALKNRCISSIRREGEYRKVTEAKTSGKMPILPPQQKNTPLTFSLQKTLCTQPGN